MRHTGFSRNSRDSRNRKDNSMTTISERINYYRDALPFGVRLVAISKFKPLEDIIEAYSAGQRVFGESRPLEFEQKAKAAPSDIEWHFIGHLQTNKIKNVVPYTAVIESVDSEHLLSEINAYAGKIGKKQSCYIEIHIAEEETKSGFSFEEALDVARRSAEFENVSFDGIMVMATNTADEDKVRREFRNAASMAKEVASALGRERIELSMGMSQDWQIAVQEGSTTVRIGSSIFGERV